MKSELFGKNIMTDSLIDLRTCTEDAGLHHHEFFELVYVISGSAEHTIDGRSMILSEGDFFFMNLKSSHCYSAIGGEFKIINCLFVPEFLDKTLSGARTFAEIMNNYPSKFGYTAFSDRVAGRVFHDGDGFVHSLFSRMLDEFSEKRRGSLDIIKSLLLTLLILLAREDEEECDEISYVGMIKGYIADSFLSDAPPLSEIAKKLGISLTYASLIFKRATGLTFTDYVIKMRMEKSCDLLRTSDKTVSEISELVGYSDPAFFYKAFRKHLGTSPAKYKKSRKI